MNKLILVALISIFLQCKTSKTNTEKGNHTEMQKISNDNQQIQSTNKPTSGGYPLEPGTCRMHGIIKEILPVDKSSDSEPCNIHPCNAMVEITQMNGCGYGVLNKPEVGSVVKINFIFTLKATDELKLKKPPGVSLKGLKVGDAFDGQIKIKNRPNNVSDIYMELYDLERN